MRIRTALPWISLLLLIAAIITPLGREILTNMSSGEALSSSIAWFAALIYFGGLLALALVEYLVRTVLIRRQQRRA